MARLEQNCFYYIGHFCESATLKMILDISTRANGGFGKSKSSQKLHSHFCELLDKHTVFV